MAGLRFTAQMSSGKPGANPTPVVGRTDVAHPTVAFLMFLVFVEYAAYLGLRYYFRKYHGG